MPITDFHIYGKLIYSLQERYASVRRSTLVLAIIGSTLAKLEGQVIFESDVVLDVWELVDFAARQIRNYRIPAPGISFGQPNLPTLIEEIEREVIPSSPGSSFR